MPEVATEPLETHLVKCNPRCGWEERGSSLKLLLKKQSFVETEWKTWGRQGRVWKNSLHESPVLQLTQRLWQKSPLCWWTPNVFPTPAGFSHPLNSLHGQDPSQLETPQLKTHRFQSDFAHLGRQNPPLTIQKWGERGEVKIPPSEHKKIIFLLHPTLPSPPSLHFLLLF